MGECQIPNGCLNDEEANACPLCDEDGADRIAAHYQAQEFKDVADRPVGPGEMDEAAIKAQLIAGARLEMDTQAARAREFDQQYHRALAKAERLEKLARGFQPLTSFDLERMLKRWKYSTCIPGRLLPRLALGDNYASSPHYVPIERRIVYSNVRSLRP